MIVGALGSIIFSVSSESVITFSNLSKSKKARVAKHDVLGSKPKLEFQGVDLIDFSFDVELNESLGVDIHSQLLQFDLAIDTGTVCPLVLGPTYHGDFLILSIENAVKKHNPDGSIHSLALSVAIQEYIYD